MDKSRAVPKTTYEPSREQVELEKIREDNHRRALHKLDQTRSQTYGYMQADKSAKTQGKLSKIVDDRDKRLQFDHFRANPPPKSRVGILRSIERCPWRLRRF